MAYTKTVWVNDSEPDIDAENLNKIEQGIYDAHQTMASLVSGVKGDAETEFRNGNVNLTKANIGLGNVDNTSDANKPVSTATQTALNGKQDTLTFDDAPTAGSNNPVKSSGIKTALDGKQATLTFDNAPTAGSSNPVKSSGVKTALDNQKYFYVDAEGYGCIDYDLF